MSREPSTVRPRPRSILARPAFWLSAAVLLLAALGWRFRTDLWLYARPMTSPFPPSADRPSLPPKGGRTLDLVLGTLGPVIDPGWRKLCKARQVAYPPGELAFVAFKDTRQLHLYIRDSPAQPWVHLREYPILAASGVPGPKLREGDHQVPEGIYGVDYLNPNSTYHLSLKVSYPNAFDLAHAKEEGREFPGTNIMIHGAAGSVGCLAVGDPAIEEIFLLAAQAGTGHLLIVVAPRDFRQTPPGPEDLQRATGNLLGNGIEVPPLPPWTGDLYAELDKALREFP